MIPKYRARVLINGKWEMFENPDLKFINGEYHIFLRNEALTNNVIKIDNETAFLERYIGLKDKNEIEGCAGDIREYYGKLYKVVDDEWGFRLERNLVEFGENEDITIDEDVMFESSLVGNIHENPELLNK